MNGMTPFKAYWNTKLIGLKGGRSTVTEMAIAAASALRNGSRVRLHTLAFVGNRTCVRSLKEIREEMLYLMRVFHHNLPSYHCSTKYLVDNGGSCTRYCGCIFPT